MKVLSLRQPWATLVAIGAKRIETRSWSTNYRGPLYIHASRGWKEEDTDLVYDEPFNSTLIEAGYISFSHIPLGSIIAICSLVSVKEITSLVVQRKTNGWQWEGPDGITYRFDLNEKEFAFGDYTQGRYAWLLHDVRPIEPLIPVRGKLGLWDFKDNA